MDREGVASSSIASIGYDAATRTLEVESSRRTRVLASSRMEPLHHAGFTGRC